MKRHCLASILFFLFMHVTGQIPDTGRVEYISYDQVGNYVIADITISGIMSYQTSYLVNISGLQIGQEISIPGEEITNTIDKFWSFGLFSDVKVVITKIEGKNVYLEIQLTEMPRLSRLQLTGINSTETKEINEKLNLRTGSQVTENILNNSVSIIKKYFTEKGFLNCSVDIIHRADTTPPGNRVYIDMHVDKGKKVKIEEITFHGNEAFSDKRLRRALKNTKQINMNIFKGSKYLESNYKEDRQSLLDFYNENGYRDARILNEKIEVLNDKRITLDITVEEGTQYAIRNIIWVGNTKYPAEALNRVLGIEKGDIYDQTRLNERLFIDEDAVQSQYMDAGHLFSSIEPVEANIEGDSIDLEMRVYEGPQATINQIIITGNTKTNEHVIRRELRTIPGDLFSKTAIIRSVRELAALGHFNPENIIPNPIPNLDDGTVDIEYQVEERSNDQLEVSGGWGGYGFVGTVGLRFANFSARKMFDPGAWRPVPSGDGQTLSIRAQSNGRYYQAYNLSFVEPWFGGKKPNSFSVSFYHTITKSLNRRNDPNLADAFFKVTGASVGIGRRLTWPDDYFVVYTEAGYQRYHLNNWGTNFFISKGFSNVIDMQLSISRSSQDQMIYPRHGSAFNLSLKLTPPVSLLRQDNYWTLSDAEKLIIRDRITNENKYMSVFQIEQQTAAEVSSIEDSRKYQFIEYHKWKFNGSWYMSLVGNLVLATKTEFGYLGYYNKNIGPSPFEKFSVGGSGMTGYNLYGTDIVALRGYPEGSLTPQTTIMSNTGSVSNIDNGNIYVKYTLELRYPISLSQSATFFGHVFLEGGNAWQRFDDFNPFAIKRSAGVGIRAYLPMFGLLGVDWGFGFDLPNSGGISDAEKRRGYHGSEFHFVMGQQF
ncbi:MAG: outer membrane protein assembly factor BamA [Bacteroidales bacterium]|nr:outer membrane protein assembly factor BamA [Bacteroidales bacterium]